MIWFSFSYQLRLTIPSFAFYQSLSVDPICGGILKRLIDVIHNLAYQQ